MSRSDLKEVTLDQMRGVSMNLCGISQTWGPCLGTSGKGGCSSSFPMSSSGGKSLFGMLLEAIVFDDAHPSVLVVATVSSHCRAL